MAEFRKHRGEAAFGELVRRYTNLVYSVAKRRLANVALAQEVTQTVFIRLAKAVPALRSEAELVVWLHRTTVHASIDLWRSEIRRRAREEHAAAMQPQQTEDAAWTGIAPILDEALNALNDGERQVILLRFFEHKSMRDLGLTLGISEDAAKMRVSRAIEHLRTLFSDRGVTIGAVALGALLTERAVEAAPAALVIALAALQFPAAAGLGVGSSIAAVLAQISKVKLAVGLAAALGLGAAAVFWLASGNRAGQVPVAMAAGETASNSPAVQQSKAGASTSAAATNGVAEAQSPDALALLQAVLRARDRIASGELEFEVDRYEFSRPYEGTNRMRIMAIFDGNKRRFESFDHEYAYTSTDSDEAAAAARIQAERLDREAAVRAGLLKGFESHHVTAYDGSLLLDYWENDRRPFQAKIQDPAKGSGHYVFDPRCLGIDASLSVGDTVERCLGLQNTNTVELLGEELVEGGPAWHVRVWRGSMPADFWLEKADPIRVLKYTFNGNVVVSKYDDAQPADPLPTEVETMSMHGTTGGQTSFAERRIVRRGGRFNIPVDPASWTLAGLGMKVGTDVVDYRISRRIGYWTGAGLSDNLPRKTGIMEGPPDRAQLLAWLDDRPETPEALAVAQWVISNLPDGPDVEKAATVILQEHITNTNLAHLCQELERLRYRCSRKLLEAMLKWNPSVEVRGNACLSLAIMRKDEAKYGENRQATAEAKKLFERVIAGFGQVKRNGFPLADLAKPELYELQRLIIGKRAPATGGEDLAGRPLKLSDYRGQVVLLVFWGECGGCRPQMSLLLKLLDSLKDRPFAILGVYCDDDVSKAKDIVKKLAMPWRSFRDGRSGPISKAWNNDSWPAFDIVDAKGVIRYRNLRELKVPEAVKALLKE